MSNWIKADKHKPAEFYAHGRESQNVLVAYKDAHFNFWYYNIAFYVHSEKIGYWMSATSNCIIDSPLYWKHIASPEVEPI